MDEKAFVVFTETEIDGQLHLVDIDSVNISFEGAKSAFEDEKEQSRVWAKDIDDNKDSWFEHETWENKSSLVFCIHTLDWAYWRKITLQKHNVWE